MLYLYFLSKIKNRRQETCEYSGFESFRHMSFLVGLLNFELAMVGLGVNKRCECVHLVVWFSKLFAQLKVASFRFM